MQTAVAGLIFWVLIALAGAIGWISNIVALVHMPVVTTGMGIARIVGIFVAPLGAVLGYF